MEAVGWLRTTRLKPVKITSLQSEARRVHSHSSPLPSRPLSRLRKSAFHSPQKTEHGGAIDGGANNDGNEEERRREERGCWKMDEAGRKEGKRKIAQEITISASSVRPSVRPISDNSNFQVALLPPRVSHAL